jgi:glycosyltransferase involved in cell wall biosynthesis
VPDPAPDVTVVIPAYNAAATLGATLAALAAQREAPDFEVVLVDDGSTDDTLAVARRLARLDERVKVLSVDHGGSAHARNAGIEAARGDFIAFLDADDTWERDFLEVMNAALTAAPRRTRAVFSQSRVFHDQPGCSGLELHAFVPGSYGLNRMLSTWNPAGNGSSLLIRSECFDEAGGFREDFRSAVDLEMWLRILGQSESYDFVGVPDVLVNYRKRADSISADLPARFDALYAMLSEYGGRLSAAERRSYSYPITLGLRSRRHREAFRLVLASLPWGPLSIVVDEQWRRVALYAMVAAVGRPFEAHVRAMRRRFGTSGAGRHRVPADVTALFSGSRPPRHVTNPGLSRGSNVPAGLAGRGSGCAEQEERPLVG